jgi:hypothetical protein
MRVSHMGLFALATVAGLACSSGKAGSGINNGNPDSGMQQMCNPCTGGDDGGTGSGDVNPDGVPYPEPPGGYGHMARAGNTPGQVIQGFSFLGYPNAVVAKTLSTIKLSDYYDPCNKRYKLLHITMAAVWCGPCNQETDQIVSLKSTLDADQVVVIQALDDGATFGVAATQSDLNGWIGTHKSNFTEMLDPGHINLGAFFDAAAIPWNANIDPRTMEVMDSGEGLPANGIMDDINQGLMEIQAGAMYPIPADAHCGG